jgi:hypothetical protein
MAASPTLRAIATRELAARLATAAAEADKPIELAAQGLREMAQRAEDAAAAGEPWTRKRLATAARAWVLGARPGKAAEARLTPADRERMRRERREAFEQPTEPPPPLPTLEDIARMRGQWGRAA